MNKMSQVSQSEPSEISSESTSGVSKVINNTPSTTNCKYQCKCWVMTWNNYPENVFEPLSQKLVPLCEKYVFAKEIGAGGTKHIQGAFILKTKMRQGAIYKLLENEFYLDKMKGKWEQQNYCTKDSNEILTNSEFKKYRKPMRVLKKEQLNAWELKIDNIIQHEEPDDRSIYWFYSKNGNMGKTTFCKYLTKSYGGCVIGGKSADSKNAIVNYIQNSDDGRAPELVICPVPKSYDMEYLNYEAIEMIKDMYFYSGKYEGGQVNDDSPHLFVFSNEKPELDKMSADRWKVYEIIDKEGNYKEIHEQETEEEKKERLDDDNKLLAALNNSKPTTS